MIFGKREPKSWKPAWFHQVRVDWFMRGSAILLMFIAAGFFSASMHQLQELDVFGVWSPRVDRPWQNRHVWDARWGKLWGDMGGGSP